MAGKRKFKTDHPDPFVRELEDIRQKCGNSQEGMARAINVPFRTYQKWLYIDQKPRHADAVLARARAVLSPKRLNCWEVFRCGKEPGGPNAHLNGPCQAALDEKADGINGGSNGGRICWAISGTPCDLEAKDSKATKLTSCMTCDFFVRVLRDKGLADFKLLKPGQTYTQT
jgi:hypothetical protein